jgi:hypothetical protein
VRIGVAKCREPDEIDGPIDAVPLALQDSLGFEPKRDVVSTPFATDNVGS